MVIQANDDRLLSTVGLCSLDVDDIIYPGRGPPPRIGGK